MAEQEQEIIVVEDYLNMDMVDSVEGKKHYMFWR